MRIWILVENRWESDTIYGRKGRRAGSLGWVGDAAICVNPWSVWVQDIVCQWLRWLKDSGSRGAESGCICWRDLPIRGGAARAKAFCLRRVLLRGQQVQPETFRQHDTVSRSLGIGAIHRLHETRIRENSFRPGEDITASGRH